MMGDNLQNQTIPEVRQEMRELASTLPEGDPMRERLERWDAELTRRSPTKRAEATSVPVTDQLRDEVRTFAKANPGMSQRDIAHRFQIDGGRVSEILRGKRGE